MTEVRNWKRTRRTGLEIVREWVQGYASKAEAAQRLGMEPGHLRIWLNETPRRFTPDTARKVAAVIGIPIDLVLFKNERACDVSRDWKWAA